VLIRTWNLFHGNSVPPQRRTFLEDAVRLAVAGEPDVVCLQEVPAWALSRLAGWSGYSALPVLAARPTIGPLPSTAELGRRLTSLNYGVLRSAFSGQGNAILVAPALQVLDHHVTTLNPRAFRRAQARWLGLDARARLAWARERRVCQAVRIGDGTRTLLVANMHATSYSTDERLADAELLRAFVYVDGLARPGEPVVVAGDFNVTAERSRTLSDVAGEEWGFSAAGPGIDHVLVRGLEVVAGPRVLEHTLDGVVVSDHSPVELEVV
jgi:endonuclease/exonuclease/phosphatase family metal-dependent hydrolase